MCINGIQRSFNKSKMKEKMCPCKIGNGCCHVTCVQQEWLIKHEYALEKHSNRENEIKRLAFIVHALHPKWVLSVDIFVGLSVFFSASSPLSSSIYGNCFTATKTGSAFAIVHINTPLFSYSIFQLFSLIAGSFLALFLRLFSMHTR